MRGITSDCLFLPCVLTRGSLPVLVMDKMTHLTWPGIDDRHQISLAKTASGVVAVEAIGIPDSCSTILAQTGPFRAACWVGADGSMFATGHEMGHLLIWLTPEESPGQWAVPFTSSASFV